MTAHVLLSELRCTQSVEDGTTCGAPLTHGMCVGANNHHGYACETHAGWCRNASKGAGLPFRMWPLMPGSAWHYGTQTIIVVGVPNEAP